MPYTLNSTPIRAPSRMREENATQYAENQTLSGTVARDYFGSNKRIWTLEYDNLNATDFNSINTIYQAYLSSKTAKTWVIDEGNYAVSSTTVHIDFKIRSFTVPGSSYISDCVLVLKEA